MTKQVLSTIAEHNMLEPGDGIVVGLSGGADSVALTHFLCNLSELCLDMVCVHVHHGLRGREADRDAKFCEEFCERLGIDLVVFAKDAAKEAQEMGVSVEEAGRILRYDCFKQVLHECNCNKIAVAHNKNDVAETVIMQIVRGAGGIRGISAINGNVIRPLIGINRGDILMYCKRHGLAYCTDSTNESNDYSRNWIRNALLPQIQSNLNPSAIDALWRLAKISKDEDVFLEDNAKICSEKCICYSEDGLVINRDMLSQYSVAIRRRVVRIALSEILGGMKDVSYEHVESVLSLTDLQSGKKVSLPKGFAAENVYNEICIRKPDLPDHFSVILTKNTTLYVSQIDMYVYLGDSAVRENAFTKVLDCGKITDVLIRTRLPGDRIFFNNVGTKKIKDFFTDKKIVRTRRDKAVFIASERDIILIMGSGPDFGAPIESHKFEPENDSKKIYLQIWRD